MSARLTRNVGPHATASAIASETPEQQVAEAGVHRARPEEQDGVVDDLHRRDGERVGNERDADGGAERRTRPQQRDQRQRVAEEERERDGQRDRGRVTPTPPGREHQPQHFADPTAREAVVRGADREPVRVHEARLTSDHVSIEHETSSLAEQLAELSNQPVDDTRLGRTRARALAFAHRATTWGPLEPIAEIGWRTMRRDASIGGSVLGAALAYRIFIWLLPFALVIVLALALFVDQTDRNIGELLDGAGITGFIASSVAEASQETKGWAVATALVVALLVLAYQSAALLRSLRAVTALAWRLPVTKTPSPTRSTLLFGAWLVGFIAIGSSAAPIRRALDFPLDVAADAFTYGVIVTSMWLVLVVVPAAPRCRGHPRPSSRRDPGRGGDRGDRALQHARPLPLAHRARGDVRRARGRGGAAVRLLPVRSDGRVGGGPQRDPVRGTTA